MTDPFAGSPLDRVSARRKDKDWLARRLEDPESRFLPLWRLNVLTRTGTPRELAWARSEIRESIDEDVGAVLLGMRGDVAHFAVDVSPLEAPEQSLGVAGAAKFEEVRALAAELPAGEAAIVAQARSMLDWHDRHRFCAKCGERTRALEAGYMRECDECDAQHFPRTDPVVIMLVERGDACLLGRQAGWPADMYSCLAGFVEPGETIEEAVRREVMEESSVSVATVRYHSSQPWPFPASLMIGCIAQATSEEIRLGDAELSEARWFERAAVRKALDEGWSNPGLKVPPPMAIAHQLLRAWSSDDS